MYPDSRIVYYDGAMPFKPKTAHQVRLTEEMCDRLRLVQEAKGLSPGEFARAIGLTPQQYSNIKRRRNPPGHETILAVMREFGVPPDYFYTGARFNILDELLAGRLRDAERCGARRTPSSETITDCPSLPRP